MFRQAEKKKKEKEITSKAAHTGCGTEMQIAIWGIQ